MGLLRFLVKLLITRHVIALAEILVVIPQVLAVQQVWGVLWTKPDLHEPMDIVAGIGVIMIGFGVVLEERKTFRKIFGLTGGPDEEWQEHLDENCHHYGAGQLVMGFVAAISIDMIKIPNSIIYTGEVDDYVVAVGCVAIAVGAVLLLKHAATLLFFMKPFRP